MGCGHRYAEKQGQGSFSLVLGFATGFAANVGFYQVYSLLSNCGPHLPLPAYYIAITSVNAIVCVCACVYINVNVCVLVCAIHLLIRQVTVFVYLLFVELLCVCV